MEALAYVSQQLVTAGDLDDYLPEALAYLGRALSVSSIYIFENHTAPDGALLTSHRYEWWIEGSTFRRNRPQLQNLPYVAAGFGRWPDVLGKGHPVYGLTRDFPESERALLQAQNIQSLAVAPITSGPRWWGFVGFDDCEEERLWSVIEIEALMSVAGALGAALASARLYQSERVARERAEVLRQFARIIGASLDHKDILRQSLHQLQRVLVFDSASIYLNPREKQSEFVAGIGFQDEEMTTQEAKQLLKTSPLLARMAQDLQPVISPDVRQLEGWVWVPGAEHVRSFMAVPLVTRDAMIGALMVDSKDVGFFKEADLQMVETLAQHISVSIENAWLFETAQQQLSEKTALLAASTAVSSSLDLATVLMRLAEQMGQAIGVTSAYISGWDPETGMSTVLAEYFAPESSPAEQVSDLGFAYDLAEYDGADLKCLRRQRPVVEHIDDPDLTDREREHLGHYGAQSVLCVPLIIKERSIGLVELWESRYRRNFTPDEITLCQAIARQTAVAMTNAQLYQAEAQRRREAETLSEVAGYLSGTLELDEVLQRTVDAVRRYLGDVQNCWISILEQDGEFLRTRTEWVDHPEHSAMPVGAGEWVKNTHISRMVLEKRKPITIANLTALALSGERARRALERELQALLYVPLLAHDKPIGIMHIHAYGEPRHFSPEEIAVCQGVASQAAIAIENARLFAAARRQLRLAQTLQQVGALLTTDLSLDEVYERIFDLLARVVEFDSVSIQLLDGAKMALAAGRGFPNMEQARAFIDDSSDYDPLKKFAAGVNVLIIPDTRADERWIDAPGLEYIRSWIGVLLLVKGRTIGILNVDSATVNAYNAQLGETVAAFANQAAVAIERAQLYAAVKEQAADLARQVAKRTAELQTERDRTLAILESAGEGIILADVAGHILYVNPAMERQSGYSRAELLNQHARIFGGEQTPEAAVDEMWTAISNRQHWSGEMVNQRKDGALYDVMMSVTPLLDPEGGITGFVSVQADISQLKEVDRLKSEFVSNVSHELRTPVTNIKTYVTLLERGKPERRGHYLQVVHHEADRLANLVQDLLDLSRLDTEASPDLSATTDLGRSVRRHFRTFAARAQAKQISLQLDIPPELPAAMIEERHLDQILMNLLGNALAYTPAGGQVTVSAGVRESAGQPMVWFCVSDNGPGITPGDMPRLFERFFRGRVGQDSGAPGTGLGLAICKEIVDRYGGRIEVESRPGVGANFTVCLPLAGEQ